MISEKIVVVVGAGASRDLKMPLGSELKSNIVEIFSKSTKTENSDFVQALSRVLQPKNFESLFPKGTESLPNHPSRRASRAINYGLDFGPAILASASIDNFVDQHRHVSDFTAAAKLAIMQSISEAERSSALGGNSNSQNFLSETNEYFLSQFMNIFVRGHSVSDFWKSFKNLTFVTFNYDRCIQRYLEQWIIHYFGIPSTRLSHHLDVRHVYGSIGDYFLGEGISSFKHSGVSYLEESQGIIKELHNGIRTFTEQIDSSTASGIRKAINESKTIVFIGFGFEEQNLKFLNGVSPAERNVFATMKGLSQSDQNFLRDDLQKVFVRSRFGNVFTTEGNGIDLLSEHYQHFTRAVRSLGT